MFVSMASIPKKLWKEFHCGVYITAFSIDTCFYGVSLSE